MSNVLEAISKLKLKNSKNHFSILVSLPASALVRAHNIPNIVMPGACDRVTNSRRNLRTVTICHVKSGRTYEIQIIPIFARSSG